MNSTYRNKVTYLGILVLLILFSFSSNTIYRTMASSEISIDELQEELTARMSRVPEFVKIRELAKKHGVNEVYLFGGTASAWAHYVQWDMEREKGINALQPDRFDYDYDSIFRSNQDIDIVIDGPVEVAEAIENEMKETFPFFQGKQSVWEVRLLNDARGEKDAILNNPDFLNQHSDSHSTGLIEVFGDGKRTVLDVKEIDAITPKFLRDVHSKILHYYYYPELHKTTKRYLQGDNPEIFSVVRCLTKAFQYELEIEPESLKNVKEVIAEFDPSKLDQSQDYIPYWLEKNGPKLFQNAVNIEYAWNTLEELGLRNKLIAINNNSNTQHSLAWWMNKEPLRSKPVGLGTGRTAKELGLDIVAHETMTLDAHESIAKAHSGEPNAFKSRAGFAGEFAEHGDGFYTQSGRTGGRLTGFTIRFHLDPNAREGSDFIYVKQFEFIIVLNKNALKVIPESLQISPVDYFDKLSKGELIFDISDKAIQEKVRRKIRNKLSSASDGEIGQIYNVIKKFNTNGNWSLYSEWLSLRLSIRYPNLVQQLINEGKFHREIATEILSKPHWKDHPELVEQLITKGTVDEEIVIQVLSLPHWKDHPELVEQLIKKGTLDKKIIENILSGPHWKDHPELVKLLIKKGTLDQEIIENILSGPHWKDHPELVEQLITKGTVDEEIVIQVLSQPHWKDHPELVEQLITKGTVDEEIAFRVISQPHWKDHPEFVEQLIKKGTVDQYIVTDVLSRPHWKDHPEWVEYYIKKGTLDNEIVSKVLTLPHCVNHPEWIEHFIIKGTHDYNIITSILSTPHWQGHPELVILLIRNSNLDQMISDYIFSQPYWSNHPYFKKLLQGKEITVENLRNTTKNIPITCNGEIQKFL